MKKLTALTILFIVFGSACTSPLLGTGISTPIEMTAEVSTVIPDTGGTALPFLTPGPSTSIPTLEGGLPVAELKYQLLEAFPDFFYCDPDYYPVAHEDEMTLAVQAFPELQADQAEYQAILEQNGLGGQTSFSDEQKLLIYREHKKLNAIYFQPVDDRYQFQIQTGLEGQEGTNITGTIDGSGSIQVTKSEPGLPTCPICLAAGTLIDTPRGAIRVEGLRVGDSVWTQDEAGRRISGSIIRTGRTMVPAAHQMIHLKLNDRRELWASPGHPTADGRMMGDLRTGDILDGSQIVHIEQLPYGQTYTFDILPSGGMGLYWANEILMGSTLTMP